MAQEMARENAHNTIALIPFRGIAGLGLDPMEVLAAMLAHGSRAPIQIGVLAAV